MSTKRTKAEKGQRKADELDKRFDDRPEDVENARRQNPADAETNSSESS